MATAATPKAIKDGGRKDSSRGVPGVGGGASRRPESSLLSERLCGTKHGSASRCSSPSPGGSPAQPLTPQPHPRPGSPLSSLAEPGCGAHFLNSSAEVYRPTANRMHLRVRFRELGHVSTVKIANMSTGS